MKNHNYLFTNILLALLFNFSSFQLYAQQPIPSNDNDLDFINEKIRVYTNLANQCASYDCPDFDCETAEMVFNNLKDARKYMRYTHFWLSLYSNTQKELLFSLANEGTITSERVSKIQDILAWQEYITNISSAMLDITGASASLKDLASNTTKLDDMSKFELINNFNTLIEGLNDFESANNAVKDGFNAEDNNKRNMFSLGNDEIDDYKSTISDLLSLVQEASKTGKDWRNLYGTSGRVAVGAIIGRIAKAYANSEIEERKDFLESLNRDLYETNFTQSKLVKDFQQVQTRRNKAYNAFKTLDKLIVIKSESKEGTLTQCLLKGKNDCPSFNYDYISTIEIPSQYQIFDIKDIEDHKDEYNSLPIGKALLYFNSKLLREVPSLLKKQLEFNESTKPSLQVDKYEFTPNESFKVQFKAPACYPYRSWVGIVPSDIISVTEEQNGNALIGSRSFLKGEKEGELIFVAPEIEGKYDLTMNNIENGFEVTSISFEVKELKLGQVHMKAINKGGKEIEYYVLIKQGDKKIKSIVGIGLTENLPAGKYKLIFSIYGEDEIEKNIEVIEGEIKEVVVDFSEEKHPIPPGWVKGTLYNSNDGSCGLKGEYIIFRNVSGIYAKYTNTFKNLETGEINTLMIVAPGDKLEVAVPVTTSWIRAYRSKSSAIDPGNLGGNFTFYTLGNIKEGWWYTAGCTDGTFPNTRCDNGNGQGYSNQFSKCETTYAEEH